jgi:hypothetical protein
MRNRCKGNFLMLRVMGALATATCREGGRDAVEPALRGRLEELEPLLAAG